MSVTNRAVFRSACVLIALSTGLGCNPPRVTSVSPGLAMNLDSVRKGLVFAGPGWSRKRKIQGRELSAMVRIRPVAHDGTVDSARGPTSPMIVAWIQNQNALFDTEKPVFRKKGAAEYLVQIYRNSGDSTAHYQVLEIPSSNVGAPTVINTGPIVSCHHPPSAGHDADFKTCTAPFYHEPYPAPASVDRLKSTLAVISATMTWSVSDAGRALLPQSSRAEDPIWIDCNAGCCTLLGT